MSNDAYSYMIDMMSTHKYTCVFVHLHIYIYKYTLLDKPKKQANTNSLHPDVL